VTDREVELHERLAMPEALLSRTDLRELGWPRRAVDAIFRELDGGRGSRGLSCGQLPLSRRWSAGRTGTILSGLECLLEAAEVIPFQQSPVIPHVVRIGPHSPLRAR
jgi:hypothetical protein